MQRSLSSVSEISLFRGWAYGVAQRAHTSAIPHQGQIAGSFGSICLYGSSQRNHTVQGLGDAGSRSSFDKFQGCRQGLEARFANRQSCSCPYMKGYSTPVGLLGR